MSLGQILVVEDEPGLLRIVARYLDRLGYGVVTAPSGCEARDAFRAGTADFVAVLTDLSLPDMRGEDLVDQLRADSPSVPVLIMSGSPAALRQVAAPGGAPTAFLEKPFTPKMLADALERLLGPFTPLQS